MKVIITGASGFVGFPLVESLAASGCEVLAISRTRPVNGSKSSARWLEADLSSPVTYEDEIQSFSPEIVIHLMWQDIPDYSLEKSISNQNQSLAFLSFVTELKSCRKVLVSGSCWEFDKAQGECLESEVGVPKDHFTWAKHSIRSWLEMACAKKNITLGWFRVFYVYGPRQRAASLIPAVLTHLKDGKLPQIKTPNHANDYIFIDDVVAAFSLAATKEFPSGIYNIGSGESIPVLEVCRLAEKIICHSTTLTQALGETSKLNASAPNIDFWAGIAVIKKHLGWEAKTSIEDGLTRTWEYVSRDD